MPAGNIIFWLAWPALWIYLRIGKRTRLLLICGDEFLVLKGWLGPGDWILPGGGLHRHEDPESGLLRELREETGIRLQKGTVKFAYTATQSSHGLKFTYNCFTAVLPSKPKVKIQAAEIADYAWQPVVNPMLPLSSDTQKALAWWRRKK